MSIPPVGWVSRDSAVRASWGSRDSFPRCSWVNLKGRVVSTGPDVIFDTIHGLEAWWKPSGDYNMVTAAIRCPWVRQTKGLSFTMDSGVLGVSPNRDAAPLNFAPGEGDSCSMSCSLR